MLNLEFLTHKEHKIQKLPLGGVLQKWSFVEKLLLKVALLEMW